MTPPAIERLDDTGPRTIEFPLTEPTQRALHEAIGHCYDVLAVGREERGDDVPDDELFAHLEALYVATADESVSRFELTYELEAE